jgi:hypothetical protein
LIRSSFRNSRQDAQAEQTRVNNVLWMVMHHPDAAILGEPSSTISTPGTSYNAVKNAWMTEIAKPAVTPQVLANAANFFRPLEPTRSLDLLAKARELDPKNWMWTAMLGQMYAFQLSGITGLNQNGFPVGVDPAKAHSREVEGMKASLLASRDTELLAAVSAGLAGQGAIAAAMTGRVEETAALSDQLLRRAQDLDPRNPKWPAMRAQAYAQKAERSTGETRAQYIRKAMDEFDAAAAIDPAAVGDMPPSLFARTAIEAGQFAKARSSAERCLQQTEASKTKDYLIHECTLLLGRVALREGKIKRAGDYLLASARVQGSGTLSSFGPNMMLAQELLQKGQRDVVLQYFELCGRFWSHDRGQLAKWTAQVQAGAMPSFGANLIY